MISTSQEILNNRFLVSSEEAGRLWVDGKPMAPRRTLSSERIRRSENGLWVIRLHDPTLEPASRTACSEASAEKIIGDANAEFTRLQEAGVDVISRAHAPSVLGRKVFTITPWIEGLRPCTYAEFREVVHPRLENYFLAARAVGIEPRHGELAATRQYSGVLDIPQVFLHDVDIRSVI